MKCTDYRSREITQKLLNLGLSAAMSDVARIHRNKRADQMFNRYARSMGYQQLANLNIYYD